jgi:hypothetical protein
MSNSNVSSYVCGVFTSWKPVSNKNLILHFAINRFVGLDLIHYDLPSNNVNKNNKKRISLYLDLETHQDLNNIDINNISNVTFVDSRFNNLIYKDSEYTLELSYTTKPYQLSTRTKNGNFVECYYFPMLNDSIVNISDSGTHLWTEDTANTKKITDISECLEIISKDIVRIPTHINNRTHAIII